MHSGSGSIIASRSAFTHTGSPRPARPGQLDQAITLLSSASSQVKLGSLQQARYDARIDQLRQLQERFRPYQKM